VLNLFGYTGLASLVAATAGAEVTHIDASKKAIAWARENQSLSGLDDKPIRWICEDAMKFAAREVRRGRQYQCILLDPPKFGRGPKTEVWRLFEHLPEMVDLCRQLIDPQRGLLLLTSYAIRSSSLMLQELCLDRLVAPLGGRLDSGELVLVGEDGRRLSTSLFARWSAV
jgi:23S rRNA (cytosine1962-C5)-methyltransferase